MNRPDENNDWSDLFGSTFESNEVVDAEDFADLQANYHLWDGFLESLVQSEGLSVGARLFLAMNLRPDVLGVMLFVEDDDRIIQVIKGRCSEARMEDDGRERIILPGE